MHIHSSNGPMIQLDFKPKWNFYKILINKSGQIEDTFNSITKPKSTKLISAIEKIL